MLKRINWLVFIILIIYPLFLIGLGINYSNNYSIGFFEIGLFILGYYGSNIAVGIGFHRLWSHSTYKTNKVVEFFLALLTAGTLQGPALAWASDHYRHHTYTDKDKDPHTPTKYQNKVLGFLWSHIGWMLFSDFNHKSIDKVTIVKLGRNKVLAWQLKNYWSLALLMNTLVPAIVGYIIGGSLTSAYAGFLFIGLGRALQQEITFCVNSLCHFAGTKKYYKGTAGDIWWMAFLLLGENWHNYHHAFPSDYRNGAKWYQLDVHKWIIYLMSTLGLAWDLERTTSVRVEAKMNETKNYLIERRKEQLISFQSKAQELKKHFTAHISTFENSSIVLKGNIHKKFKEINDSLSILIQQINRNATQLTEKSSERILKAIDKKLHYTEKVIRQICAELGLKERN